MKFLSRDNLIVGGIVLAMAAASWLLVYMPQGRTLSSLRSQRVLEQATLDSTASMAAVVPELSRRVEELKSRYHDFDRRLPAQIELGGFLKEISASLGGEGIVNQSIEPMSPKKEELYHTLPITMKFKGTFLSLARFLHESESMARLTKVQRLVISPDNNDRAREADKLNIELQLNIYFTES